MFNHTTLLRVPMRRSMALAGLSLIIAFAGCGDDEKVSVSTAAQQAVSTQERSAAPVPTPLKLSAAEKRELRKRISTQEGLSAALIPVVERLELAGYRQRLISGLVASGQTSVFDGPLTVTLYDYDRQDELAAARSRLTALAKEQPGRSEITVRGKRIYFGTVAAPDKLDAARFTRIVDIAEGS